MAGLADDRMCRSMDGGARGGVKIRKKFLPRRSAGGARGATEDVWRVHVRSLCGRIAVAMRALCERWGSASSGPEAGSAEQRGGPVL